MTNDHYPCKHIEKVVMLDPCASTPILLKESTLQLFPFPPNVQQHLKDLGRPETTIQRVSHGSFVLRIKEESLQYPLKLLHIQMDGRGKIHCQCSAYKSSSTLSGVHTSLHLSKRCIHIYCGLWALLSHPSLQFTFHLQLQQAVTGECKFRSSLHLKAVLFPCRD